MKTHSPKKVAARRMAVALALGLVVTRLEASPKVGVLLGDGVSPFGKEIVAALPKLGAERGLDIVVRTPPETENVSQMRLILLAWARDREIRGMIVACGLGADELAAAARPLAGRGAPIVALLGRMPKGAATSTVLVDEKKLIAAAVDAAAGLVGDGGEAALLRSNLHEGRMNDRERLFIVGLRARHPRVKIDADVFMNPEDRSPVAQAKLLVGRYPGATLFYSPYTTATSAMLTALRETGRAGKVHHIGIGAGLSPECGRAIEDGELDALISISPHDVAAKAIGAMADALAGKAVPPVVFSDVRVITRASLEASRRPQ